MFGKSKKKIEQETIMRALKGDAMVCAQCVHYNRKNGQDTCIRDRHIGFHVVTGKVEEQGERHYCKIEREIETDYESLVEAGKMCGAIGQFWKQKKEPESWFARWITK